MLIRTKRVAGNAGGRVGCQVQHHHSAAIYYVTIEQGHIVARAFDGREIGREPDRVTITPLELSADFETSYLPYPGRLIVTVGGFPAGTDDSGIETFMLDVHI